MPGAHERLTKIGTAISGGVPDTALVSGRYAAGLSLAVLAVATPVATGTVPEDWIVAYLLGAGVAVVLLGRQSRKGDARVARGLLLALGVFGLSMAGVDAVARPLLTPILYDRPHDRYFVKLPMLPLLYRYQPNVSVGWRGYGDLAALAGDGAAREYRHIRFVTDEFGFVNEPSKGEAGQGPLDLIVLGDSFGAGSGTTQEATWVPLLAGRHRLRVYNLSMPGSPWHEFMNLVVEGGRLPTRAGTVVVWALVPSNDLDDYYYAGDLNDLPWEDTLGALAVRFRMFRDHSPVRQVLQRLGHARQRPIVITRRLPDGRPLLFHADYAQRRSRTEREILAHPKFQAFHVIFRSMVDLARARGFSLAVVVVPSKEEIYGWALDGGSPWSTRPSPGAFTAVLRHLAAGAGLPFLDLEPDLRAAARASFEASGELLWWRDDTHWNERGHGVVARLVFERLLAPLVGGQAGEAGEAERRSRRTR